MGTTRFLRNDGDTADLDVEALRGRLHGTLLTPGQAEYVPACALWNAMIERRPAAILRCAGAADVIQGVRFAAEHRLLLSVRGGGHNVAGDALCTGGLAIDLSPMRYVRVDPDARLARVAGGATLADVDAETQAFGLATPLGINSTTGVGGLALGGGFGWLSRRYGLTIDNLQAADVVTADGELVHASSRENEDLFWAIRGGGGNFGVVTSFELRLHPVGPEVLAGLIVHRLDDAAEVLEAYRRLTPEFPDELACWAIMRKAPPLPFLPPEEHGREILVLAVMYTGDPAEGRRALSSLRSVGKPLADMVGPLPFRSWQQTFDPLLAPGARNYWKSHNFDALDPALLPVLLDAAARLPSAQTEIFLGQLGGAVTRVARQETAYPHRDARFVMNVHTRWNDPAEDGACVGWAREFFFATAAFASSGVYVNFVSEGDDRVAAAYGASYPRLAEIKRRRDPGNLFRINQNIRPAMSAQLADEGPQVSP